jgi:L-alanine-DL-glutamate epimerase-like enolase superfamily enzyme
MFQPVPKPDDDGFATVPDRPGIGYELNVQFLGRYRVG